MSESEDPIATDEVPADAGTHDDKASQHANPDVSESVLDSQGLIKDPVPPAATVQRADVSATESPTDVPASGDAPISEPTPVPTSEPSDVRKGDSPFCAAPAVSKRLSGRRAPAPLPEPLRILQRKKTSPVVVSSTPKSCPPAEQSAMDTSVSLKRKDSPLPPRGKKPAQKKKYS